MNKKTLLALTVIVLVVGGAAWAAAYFGGESDLDRVRASASEMFGDRDRDLSEEERRQQRDDFRAQVESLSEEDRRQLFDDWRQKSMERFEGHVDNLLAMTEEDRNAALDEQIDREEAMRERFEQRRQERAQGDQSQGDQARGRGDRGRGGWGGGSRDANSRNERRREMLDHTSPEFRAKMTEYRRLVKERREARGLPDSGGWGGGRHRG